MVADDEGSAGGDAELFSGEAAEGLVGAILTGDSLFDQVMVFRLSTGETRLSRATSVAMTTSVANAARMSRVREFQAHFILLI